MTKINEEVVVADVELCLSCKYKNLVPMDFSVFGLKETWMCEHVDFCEYIIHEIKRRKDSKGL